MTVEPAGGEGAAAAAARLLATPGLRAVDVEDALVRAHLLRAGARLTLGHATVELPDQPMRRHGLVEQLDALLGGAAVTVELRRPSRLLAIARRATSGLAAQLHVVARTRTSAEGRPLHVVVPAPTPPDSLLAEHIADAIDVTFAIRRRFGAAVSHTKTISFDQSTTDLRTLTHAGHAVGKLASMSVAADFATVAGYAAIQQRFGVHLGAVRAIVAHEAWHLIDAWLMARRPATRAALHRTLGEHLGSDTLEHVTDRAGAPRDRLTADVSAYAATNPLEATAEMFEQWWVQPATDWTPTVEVFARFLDEHLPPARLHE